MAETVTCSLCGSEVEPVADVWMLPRLPGHDWYPGGPHCLRSGWLVELAVSAPG